MMARRLSSVAARTASAEVPGALPSMALAILASTAGATVGHWPSRADSQSGRTDGAWRGVQAGSCAARLTWSAWSASVAKKAFHEGSTDPGFSAHRA
jgi:hypothetical protein